jgi:hypothetical protein
LGHAVIDLSTGFLILAIFVGKVQKWQGQKEASSSDNMYSNIYMDH